MDSRPYLVHGRPRPPCRSRRSTGTSTATRLAARYGATRCSSCRTGKDTATANSSAEQLQPAVGSLEDRRFLVVLRACCTIRPPAARQCCRNQDVHGDVPRQPDSSQPHPSDLAEAARVLSRAERHGHRRHGHREQLRVAAGPRDRQGPVHATHSISCRTRRRPGWAGTATAATTRSTLR